MNTAQQHQNSTQLEGVTYDRYGRMNYHPDLHARHGKPWTTTEQNFLIENYDKIGPEETSFALERTIHTVMTKAYQLRKGGLLAKATTKTHHRRMRQNDKTN